MSTNGSDLLREWFAAACDLPEAEWEPFLEAGCEDAGLRAEVLDLLRRDHRDALVLDEPLLRPTQREALAAPRLDAPVPETIADYRVVRLIGRGSMGTVYEAMHPGTGARVAVKVLRTGIPSAALLHRFRREAELLARLDHPYIAKIHDSGSAKLGPGSHPYLAMELVDGLPLDEYCALHRLDDRQRLELVARIAEGVEHAHARGIVHRDLKPSNVLVDGRGRPRLIDFGVARALSVEQEAASLRTATGQLIGTLQYMSPEQVLGISSKIDARADVYALGVIAYELLAGRPPYDVEGGAFSVALERIRSEDPPLLGALRTELRGDVEAIIARALEKDPERRYASARALALDLEAALDARPVVARRPGALDQLRRFGERNPGLVRAAAAILCVLLLGIGGTGWGWREAHARQRTVSDLLREQRQLTQNAELARSELEAANLGLAAANRKMEAANRESEVVLQYLEDMFRTLRHEWKGPEVKLRDVLAPAAEQVDELFTEEPRIAARLHHTMGVALWTVADYEEALHSLDEVVRLVGDEGDARVLSARMHRALVRMDQGLFSEATAELEQVLASTPDEERALRAQVTQRLARSLLLGGDVARSGELLDEFFGSGRYEGLDPVLAERIRLERANLQARRGEFAAAEAGFDTILAARRARLGEDHVRTLEVGEHLSSMLIDQRRYAEAEPLLRRRASILSERAGPEHPQSLHARGRVAFMLVEAGRGAEAVDELLELVAASGRVLGEDHPRTVALLTSLSVAALSSGHPDGPALVDEALNRGREVYGEKDPRLLATIINASYLRYSEGQVDEAVWLAREGLAICAEVDGTGILDEMSLAANLAGFLFVSGRLDEAEEVVLAALPEANATLGERHDVSLNLSYYLADIHRRAERWSEALELYDRFRELDPNNQHAVWLNVHMGRNLTLKALGLPVEVKSTR